MDEQEDDIDTKEVINKIKYVLKNMTAKDFIIMLMLLMMFLMYILYINHIGACNNFYQEIIRNMTVFNFATPFG